MPNELQGRVLLVDEAAGKGHTLVSGETFNRVARLIKYLSSSSLSVGVGPNGGLRLEIVQEGGSSSTGGAEEDYDGPFALRLDGSRVRVNSGYISRNGEFRSVSGTTLSRGSGTVCVSTQLGANGNWSSPQIHFATPSQWDFPIGKCAMKNGQWHVTSFRVPVAFFIATAVCPLAREGN